MRERITIADLHNNQLVNRFHDFFCVSTGSKIALLDNQAPSLQLKKY